jgi:hypothetical protein
MRAVATYGTRNSRSGLHSEESSEDNRRIVVQYQWLLQGYGVWANAGPTAGGLSGPNPGYFSNRHLHGLVISWEAQQSGLHYPVVCYGDLVIVDWKTSTSSAASTLPLWGLWFMALEPEVLTRDRPHPARGLHKRTAINERLILTGNSHPKARGAIVRG